MSNDTRLGVDPLNWMAPGGPSAQHIAAAPNDTVPTDITPPAPPIPGGGMFLPAQTPFKENPMSKDKVKIKQTLDTAQVVAHLEDLADSLKSGIVRVDDGTNSIVLCADETMNFEMKISRKKDKAKCSIDLEWTDDGSKLETFRISDK
jgi:amphi-Trp domain-containing protein